MLWLCLHTLALHYVQAGPTYVNAFMSVLKAVSKEDTVQYVLALLLQMLQGGGGKMRGSCSAPGLGLCWLSSATHSAVTLD